MKALIIIIAGPIVLMFTIAAFQTIEWNIENDMPVPFLTYIPLIIAAIWCICAAKLKKSDIDEFDNLKNK